MSQGLPACVHAASILRRVPVIPFQPGSGLRVLGCPVTFPGDPSFAAQLWQDRASDVARACEVLRQLPAPHVQFCILRLCLSACKVDDLLRVTPHLGCQPILVGLSRELRSTLEVIQGAPLSDAQWLQASLPSRLGGLGIRDPVYERTAARLAGILDFLTRGHRLVDPMGFEPHLPADLEGCLRETLAVLGSNSQPALGWSESPSLIAHAASNHIKQNFWSNAFAEARQALLREQLSGPDAVRFASQASPHTMAWTSVIPSQALRTLIPGEEFRCALRWHLGSPQSPLPDGGLCPQCQTPMDPLGHHLVCCKHNHLSRRHGAVQDAVLRLTARAGLTARREQGAPDGSRPGDIFVHRLNSDGPAAVDITIRHSLRPSGPVSSPDHLPGWMAAQEAQKHRKYDPVSRRLGWQFIPFVVDCWGGLGAEARNFVGEVLKFLLPQCLPSDRRSEEGTVWQSLSLTLLREVGKQLLVGRLAPSIWVNDLSAPPGADTHNPYDS